MRISILGQGKKDTWVLNKRVLTLGLNLRQDEMLRTFGFELRKNVEIQAALKTICIRLSCESYYRFGNCYSSWNLKQFKTNIWERLLTQVKKKTFYRILDKSRRVNVCAIETCV